MDLQKRPLGADRRVSNQPAQTKEVDEAPAQPPAEPPKKSKKTSRSVTVLALLFVLALVAAGAFGYMWYNSEQSVKSAQDVMAEQGKQIAELRNQVDQSDDEQSADPDENVEETTTDEQAIIDMATLYTTKIMVSDLESVTDYSYTISNSTDEFASVSVNHSGAGGFAMLLKKADGQWVVIHSGHQIDQETLDRYGVPPSFMSVTN